MSSNGNTKSDTARSQLGLTLVAVGISILKRKSYMIITGINLEVESLSLISQFARGICYLKLVCHLIAVTFEWIASYNLVCYPPSIEFGGMCKYNYYYY